MASPACPKEAISFQVFALDGQGNPLLTRHELGQGHVYFVTYPWEHLAPLEPEANRRFRFYSLYQAFFLDAGLAQSHAGTDP